MALNEQKYPSKLLTDAVDSIKTLPGVGNRSALRLALHLLRQPIENVHYLTSSINNLRENVKYCSECMMISDDEYCSICKDKSRDHNIICVVENVRDVMSIENTGQYHGVYHVLGGIISPINGIGASDLTISALVQRIKKLAENGLTYKSEIIMALNADVEGEMTTFYIYRLIAEFGIKISSLARGLGFGDELEYADELTLGRSIINRQLFKPEIK